MSTDLIPRLWLSATTYPGLAVVALIIICLLGTLCALCLVSMIRHELPLHQWADDDEQRRAVSRPVPLPGAEPAAHPPTRTARSMWQRSGGNWWPRA